MKEGYITEVSYDSDTGDIGYCNLFDEKNSGQYGPYKHDSDTAKQYSEGEIDPSGAGWYKNLSQQFERRHSSGFKFIELDNPDAYSTADVLKAIDIAKSYGLEVIAKNPELTDDPERYIKACVGIIVEKDAGSTPDSIDNLRYTGMPVWFVSYGNGLSWIQEIDITPYDNMYKSYSRHGEYTSYEPVN
jgi:hypothetical protein